MKMIKKLLATTAFAAMGTGVLSVGAPDASAAVWNQSAGPLWCVREPAGPYGSLVNSYTDTVRTVQLYMVHANSNSWVRATVTYYFYDANWRWTGQTASSRTLYAPPNQTQTSTVWGYFDARGTWVFTTGQTFHVSGQWTGPNVLAQVSFYDYGSNVTNRWSYAYQTCS